MTFIDPAPPLRRQQEIPQFVPEHVRNLRRFRTQQVQRRISQRSVLVGKHPGRRDRGVGHERHQ